MIDYQIGLDGASSDDLDGFFEGWPTAPDADGLARILHASSLAIIARANDRVVGFANALSDGLLAVYIPLLEVRADYRGQGIGTTLVNRIRDYYSDAYMIDAICDEAVAPFYERLGMARLAGMAHRNRMAPILGRSQ